MLAARFGFAASHWLFYGKAGGAWVGNSASITNVNTGFTVGTSNTNSGWVLGAGVEYAFTPNWTARLEYDYIGLKNWTSAGVLPGDTLTLSRNVQMLTLGFNYKFGWGAPVVANY
jgi:outer membrane immunogenic protein